jgi:hypothetical protein
VSLIDEYPEAHRRVKNLRTMMGVVMVPPPRVATANSLCCVEALHPHLLDRCAQFNCSGLMTQRFTTVLIAAAPR